MQTWTDEKAPLPAGHTVRERSAQPGRGVGPDERPAAAEGRGADALHHRPVETNQRIEKQQRKIKWEQRQLKWEQRQ